MKNKQNELVGVQNDLSSSEERTETSCNESEDESKCNLEHVTGNSTVNLMEILQGSHTL
jgi:hypothetical protein